MDGATLISMIIGIAIGSGIGGLILWLLAKNIGQIDNATFGNSFLVCLISSSINFAIWYLIGMDSIEMGFVGIFLINLIILSAVYITVGKFIWQCEWIESVKANALWIIIYALLMGFTISEFS